MRFVSMHTLALVFGAASACAVASAPAVPSSAAVGPASSAQQHFPNALRPTLQQALARDGQGLSWNESRVLASDGAGGSQFGYSISVSGDTALVGAPMVDDGQGAAYLFTRSNDAWSEVARITADDGAPGDRFGWSVSLSGTTALIGANTADANRGAAYVFSGSGSAWTQAAKLVADDGAADDRFGNAVAINGGTALVSAATASPNGIQWQGAGYVFTESGGSWSQAAKLVASDGVGNDQLGVSVALEGDTAVLGTPLHGFFSGAAYVFTGPDWSQTKKLTASNGGPFSGFGASLAMDGSNLVVGANLAAGSVGAVYVFTQSDGDWEERQILAMPEGVPATNFGASAAIDGDTLVVGANDADDTNGAAYVFENKGGTWVSSAKLTASDASAEADYGYSVSIDGGLIGIGAGLATVAGNAKQGATYFYAPGDSTGTPVAEVSPAEGFDFAVEAGAIAVDTLVIGNAGTASLTWSIAESPFAARLDPPSHKNTPAAKYAAGTYGSPARLGRAGTLARGFGAPLILDATMISQMADNSPGDEGVACTGETSPTTSDNSWWRRFYFHEHPQVDATANITSVTVSTSSGNVPGGLPSTINLYTIPHSTPVDTIPTAALTLIGTATTTIDGLLSSVVVPVSGTVADTANLDLVVEWHTDGSDDGAFYPGANATAETHPTFLSSHDCGLVDPTAAANVGFPDFHLTMVVALGEDDAAGCENPADVPWLSTAPASGTVAAGASSDVAVSVNAAKLGAGTYSANLCVATNDPLQALVTVPVRVAVAAAPPADTIFCSGFESGENGACGTPPTGDIVASGPINHVIQNSIDGTSVNWITGDIQDADVAGYHFNPYNNSVQLTFWWETGAADIAGVSASATTSDFLVLQSGAVVGPASAWSTINNPGSAAWADTADGYLGFRFNCSSLPDPPAAGICYGYVHLKTTAPDGFPAVILDYAYDRSGAAITVP